MGAPIPAGWRKVDFVATPKAPTLDDIFEAYRTKRIVCGGAVKDVLREPRLLEHIEQFNFGKLSVEAIREASSESFDFIESKLFSLPYAVCIYRCSIDYGIEKGVAGCTLLLVSKDDKPCSPFTCIDFTKSPEWMVAIHSENNMKIVRDYASGERALEVQLRNSEHEFWSTRIRNQGGESPQVRDLIDGNMVAAGLTMILNTKGIRKERIAPPAKPNKARAAKGRPLLPWVTRVYTDVYNKAIAPGEGTHASPRPHRRRAHVRHYPERGARKEYWKPIAAMLVNWDGRPLERGEYEVKEQHHDE